MPHISWRRITVIPHGEDVRNIFSVSDIPPEVLAYAMASFSRSDKSLKESISTITKESASKFLEKFYINYGHKSIADMAHIPMSLENITMLDAIEVEDEQLWDGQERSSRYQDFAHTGFTVPQAIVDLGLQAQFNDRVKALFDLYSKCMEIMQTYYKSQVPQPKDMSNDQYDRTIRARAFDVARYYLPLCTNTSVCQIVNARTLEEQISRLLDSKYCTVRNVGSAIKQASLDPSVTPNGIGLPIAPTLVKYTVPSDFMNEVYKHAQSLLVQLMERLNQCPPRPHGNCVDLVVIEDPVVEILSKAIYWVSQYRLRDIAEAIGFLDPSVRTRWVDIIFGHRRPYPYNELPRMFKTTTLNFDIKCDIGTYRDLHRHRRTIQIRQMFNPFRWIMHDDIIKADKSFTMEAEAILQGNAKFSSKILTSTDSDYNVYVYNLPLCTQCTFLFSMDIAEAIYITELRSRPAGHISYRQIAWRMYEELIDKYPSLKDLMYVTHPSEGTLLQR